MREIVLIATMWIVTVCTYISYIPQIAKLVKVKKSEELSIMSWLLWMLSAFSNLLYSFVLGRIELVISSISEFILIVITLTLTIYYNYKNNYYLEPEKNYLERLNRLKSKDGNHMILITGIQEDRERRKENRNKIWCFRDKIKDRELLDDVK